MHMAEGSLVGTFSMPSDPKTCDFARVLLYSVQ